MKRLIIALALITLSASAFGKIYKWVDENGKVHYSDSPPPGDTAKQVELPPQPSEESLQRGREEIARRIQNQRDDSAARRQAKEEQREARDEQERKAAERTVRCAYAQDQLRVLQTQAPVYRENEDGERVFADDEFRAAEQERFRQEVAEYCD